MARDWLAANRSDVAAEKILDAAEDLFTRHGPESVGMNDIAKAAGCSRATLYRYFENRDALHRAYVHREANREYAELDEIIKTFADPHARLVEGVLASLRRVRESPALSSWFASDKHPLGGDMADRSELIQARSMAFLRSLGVDDAERRARWLVRVIVSLLVFPGHDEADERAMLEEFVVPTVLPTERPSRRGSRG